MKPYIAVFAMLVCTSALSAEPMNLDWLQGHWCQTTGNAHTEEVWMKGSQGSSVGMARTLVDGNMTSFEYLRIVHKEGRTEYIAQPNGNPPTVFVATDTGPDSATFENPDHDFPQRISYARNEGGLVAEISGPSGGEKPMVIEIDYKPCEAK